MTPTQTSCTFIQGNLSKISPDTFAACFCSPKRVPFHDPPGTPRPGCRDLLLLTFIRFCRGGAPKNTAEDSAKDTDCKTSTSWNICQTWTSAEMFQSVFYSITEFYLNNSWSLIRQFMSNIFLYQTRPAFSVSTSVFTMVRTDSLCWEKISKSSNMEKSHPRLQQSFWFACAKLSFAPSNGFSITNPWYLGASHWVWKAQKLRKKSVLQVPPRHNLNKVSSSPSNWAFPLSLAFQKKQTKPNKTLPWSCFGKHWWPQQQKLCRPSIFAEDLVVESGPDNAGTSNRLLQQFVLMKIGGVVCFRSTQHVNWKFLTKIEKTSLTYKKNLGWSQKKCQIKPQTNKM